VNLAATTSSLLVLGQTGAELEAAGSAVNAAQLQSVWDFVVKGGPMMIPIAICSLVTVTVIVERLVTLRRRTVIPEGFEEGFRDALHDGHETEAAQAYCQSNGSPIAAVFEAGIKRLHAPIEVLEKHIQEAGQRVVVRLRKNLRVLSVIAAVSPLLGLLGTIFGMITAFQTVATSSEALGKAELLATGIYQAMITTAAGLLVAIPSLLGYHWISARVEGLVVEMDRLAYDFVEDYGRSGATSDVARSKLHAVKPEDSADEPDSDARPSLASA